MVAGQMAEKLKQIGAKQLNVRAEDVAATQAHARSSSYAISGCA